MAPAAVAIVSIRAAYFRELFVVFGSDLSKPGTLPPRLFLGRCM